MLYLSSQSTGDGRLTVSVVFRQGTDVDQAQVLVQNRVSVAEPRLPEEVRRLGITVKKASPDLLMVVHMTSPDGSRSPEYVSNFATLAIKDRLARLDGVGDAQVFGARDYAMRVWLDPDRVAARGLSPGEVVDALRRANAQVAAGAIGQAPRARRPARSRSACRRWAASCRPSSSTSRWSPPAPTARRCGCATWHGRRSAPPTTRSTRS
jgi:HAE1 family hydrophobic/amphiphilic exporter-1